MSFALDETVTKNPRNYDCNEPCMQRHSHEHYSSVGHCRFLEHVSITLIDKTDVSDPFKREDYSRQTVMLYNPSCLMIVKRIFVFRGVLPHYVIRTRNI